MNDSQFDETFWANVHRRASNVREMAMQELDQAEQMLLSEQVANEAAGANVVPVFTETFWEEVGVRAQRVRQLAMSSVAQAEELLVGDRQQVETVTVSREPARRGLRGYLRNLPLHRSDAFGFGAAFLAVVLLVPQIIAPVMISAGVEPPKIVEFLVIGDPRSDGDDGDEQEPQPEPQQAGEEGSTKGIGTPDNPTVSEGGTDGKPASPGGSNAPDGTDSSSDGASGAGGASGAAANGTPAPGQSGASGVPGGVSPSPSPEASPAPRAPFAPGGLTAEAVDSTSIRLAWVDNSTDETGFQINRTGVEAPTPAFQGVAKDVKTYLWTNITPSTQACFRVRALGAELSSNWAPSADPGTVCATTPAAPVDNPPATQPQSSTGTQPQSADSAG